MSSLVFLYLCECEARGVTANSALVSTLHGMEDGAATSSELLVQRRKDVCLDVSRNVLGDRGSAALVKTFLGMMWLQSANLNGCGAGHEAVEALCEVVPQHRSLRFVDLRSNPIFASSARALANAVSSRPAALPALTVLCDLDNVPKRIGLELMNAMGRKLALETPLECLQRSSVFGTVIRGCAASQKKEAAWEALLAKVEVEVTKVSASKSSTSSVSSAEGDHLSTLSLFRELRAQEGHVAQLFSRFGPFACHLCLDYGVDAVSAALSHADWFPPRQLSSSSLGSRSNQGAFDITMELLFRPLSHSWCAADRSKRPIASDAVWESVCLRRGTVLHEQWRTIEALRHRDVSDKPAAEVSTKYSSASSDNSNNNSNNVLHDGKKAESEEVDDALHLLSHVLRCVVATRSLDLAVFATVEAHLDAVYRTVVLERYESQRALLLVCQQLGYLIQNSRDDHRAWLAKSAVPSPATRIDVGAAVAHLADHCVTPYSVMRVHLTQQALALLTPLMREFLLWSALVAAEAQQARRLSPDGRAVPTLATLLTDEYAAVDESSLPAGAEPQSDVTRAPLQFSRSSFPDRFGNSSSHSMQLSGSLHIASAVGTSMLLATDVATTIGRIRGPEQMKLLYRHYCQWVRWQYLIGNLKDDDLLGGME